VINAAVHTDDAQRGAPIRLSLFDDRLEVESAGFLPFGLTIEDLPHGVSKPRNRVIGCTLHALGLIEQCGSGIQRMMAACQVVGPAAPVFEEMATRFRATIRTTQVGPTVDPLPFLYLSTGVETRFINGVDPDPKTRAISANLPHCHWPETLAKWISAENLDAWVKRLRAEGHGLCAAADDTRPSSFRGRITTMPPLDRGSLDPNQIEAATHLEHSLKRNGQRVLIRMATGSGKTIAAITAICRIIKFGGSRRVLLLVDRSSLGE